MGREKRRFEPGTSTHLMAHGVDDQRVFRCDLDRHALLALLRKVTVDADWQVVAWCLMDTHYHLLVRLGGAPRVPWALQAVNGVYARDFNRRHGRRGHVFGERFRDTPVLSDAHLSTARGYVLDNPVRAGAVRHATEWAWSGERRLEPRRGPRAVPVRRRG